MRYGDDKMKPLAYNTIRVIFWGAAKEIVKEKAELLEKAKALIKEMTSMKGEFAILRIKLKASHQRFVSFTAND